MLSVNSHQKVDIVKGNGCPREEAQFGKDTSDMRELTIENIDFRACNLAI